MWGGIARFCTVWMKQSGVIRIGKDFSPRRHGVAEKERPDGEIRTLHGNSQLVNFQRHKISIGLAAGLVISVDLAIVPVTGELVGANQ
jgi:hypothetical protein